MNLSGEQWTNQLQGQRYPFAVSSQPTAGSQLLPDDLILDMTMMAITASLPVSLSAVLVDEHPTLVFSDADGLEVGRAELVADRTDVIADDRIVGFVLSSEPARTAVGSWTAGSYELDDAPLLPHVVQAFDPAWLPGVQLPGGEVLRGDVYLVADQGLLFRDTPDGVVLDIVGDPYAGRNGPVRALQTINSQAPDAQGQFIIRAEAATPGQAFRLNIVPGTDQIRVEVQG